MQCYLGNLTRLAPRHGFGFVGEKQGKSMQIMSGGRAAAYLSSYFSTGKGRKATLQENVRNPHLPRMLIWVSPTLTGATGITMRNLSAVSTAVGGADGAASSAVVVGRRACADRDARRAVARSGAVMGGGPGGPPAGWAPGRCPRLSPGWRRVGSVRGWTGTSAGGKARSSRLIGRTGVGDVSQARTSCRVDDLLHLREPESRPRRGFALVLEGVE